MNKQNITENFSKKVAAIDIGSNAIRLAIADIEGHGEYYIENKYRIPLRLGTEAFFDKKFSRKTIKEFNRVFAEFRSIIAGCKVEDIRICATSALRDARNSHEMISNIKNKYGLEIEIISGLKEAEMVFDIINHELDIDGKSALLMDIGGGSLELIVVHDNQILGMKSFDIGTVRLMELDHQADDELENFLENYLDSIIEFLRPFEHYINQGVLVGTGGNMRRLGKLSKNLFQKTSSLTIDPLEVEGSYYILKHTTETERVHHLGMTADRAEVIIYGLQIARLVLKAFNADKIFLPRVGLIDAILFSMAKKEFSYE